MNIFEQEPTSQNLDNEEFITTKKLMENLEKGKKRRIGGESREEEVTHLTDDGFAWRKYGQKLILNSQHPRHYYRCTHKHDQSCPATKQVQQISDKPIKYKVIYNDTHTCNNNFCKTPPSFTIDDSQGDHPNR